MECTGCRREAKFMVLYPNNPEPHCQYCLSDAVDSSVPVKVMSMDAYERMMKDVGQSNNHPKAS